MERLPTWTDIDPAILALNCQPIITQLSHEQINIGALLLKADLKLAVFAQHDYSFSSAKGRTRYRRNLVALRSRHRPEGYRTLDIRSQLVAIRNP